MHSVVHVEIPARDLKRAKNFYGKAFGWTFQDVGMDYTLFNPPDGKVGGGIYLAKRVPAARASVRAYIEVEDIDATLKTVRSTRGKVLVPKAEVQGQGWYAAFRDPQGAELWLWQSARR